MISRITTILLTLLSATSYSQQAGQIMIGIQTDLIKSDNDSFGKKMQGGIEGAFYPTSKVALTASGEWWSSDRQAIAILGARIRPIEEAFLRARWLINKDASIGAGFSKPLSGNFFLEAMTDFYFEGNIAIRAGITYGVGPLK